MSKDPEYWDAQYQAIARRAFECHVLELVQGYGPIQDALSLDVHGRESNPVFKKAELIGEYPDTRVFITTYDHQRDKRRIGRYKIWHEYFAVGEVGVVKNMRSPEYIAGDMLMWARGG